MSELMMKLISNLLSLRRSRPPAGSSTCCDPAPVTIRELWNDFDRRGSQFDAYRKSLHRTDPRLLNWIGSIDCSGYIRERSLRDLISHYVPGDENRILLRLSDWVPQVQSLARDWVLAHFSELGFAAICENARLLLFLTRKQRLQGDPALGLIQDVLLAKVRNGGGAALFALPAALRKHLFRLSLAGDGTLRQHILDDPEPFNRLLILDPALGVELSDEERRRIRTDRSVFVKRQYLYHQFVYGPRPTREELQALAFDPNGGLRDIARFYLRRDHGVDAYSLYKASEGDSFYYIADFANEQDTGIFLQGIRSGRKRVRLLCLRALCSADPGRLRELPLQELIQESRHTRRILLQYLPEVLKIEELHALETVLIDSSPNGAVSYLNLVYRKSYWQFVDTALRILADNPSEAALGFICQVIATRASVAERLRPVLRVEITQKIDLLKGNSDGRIRRACETVEFALRFA